MPLVTFVLAVIAIAVPCFFLSRLSSRRQQIIVDLEERLTASEEALRTTRRELDLMFSGNPYPMWIVDRKTMRYLAANDAAVHAYGYSREEFLQMTLLDIRPPEDVPILLEDLKAAEAGYVRPGIRRHRRKDGTLLYVEIMAFRFDSVEGKREIVIALDMTERHRMEQALRESEGHLKALIDHAPFGIAQATPGEDRLRTANPAFLQMLGGYTHEEALQLKISEQIYSDPKERGRVLEVLQRNGQLLGWETSLRTRNGTLVPVRLSMMMSGDDHGSAQLISAYVEDMTQQSKLEQQVRQVQKLEAVGRLAGGMAHDFNNVLVVIKLSTELMLGQVTPDSAFSKPLLQIANAANRAAALTRQMLAFGRQQILQPRILNLNQVVGDTIQMLRRVIGEDIELVTKLSDDLQNCRLDPDQVTQVILNLAVNARDAMPTGGALEIETANVYLDAAFAQEHPPLQPGNYVLVAVTDNGTGIESANMPRIFDPFFTTKEVGKGTGLGLSIVYGIVKQSGGYIWVYSEVGHGTTFKLWFPATTARLERVPLRAEPGAPVAGQVVLVVEDEPSIRTNVSECLQQIGYRSLNAANAVEALQICEELQGQVDLVLTDLVMPGKGGREMTQELARRYPHVRALFMSGYTDDSTARRDLLTGGSRFISKPFSVADLATAVSDALLATPLALEDS
jgi:PAS domain S-box-containing protein